MVGCAFTQIILLQIAVGWLLKMSFIYADIGQPLSVIISVHTLLTDSGCAPLQPPEYLVISPSNKLEPVVERPNRPTECHSALLI